MSIVKVTKNTYTVEPLYQWDVNQVLQVYGMSLAKAPEVHFTNAATSRAIPRQASMDAAGVITVSVPNSLLQKPYAITAHICGYTGTTFETFYKLAVPVKERQQPADYTLTDDPEVYSFNALENAVVNAQRDMVTATETLKETNTTIEQKVAAALARALPAFLDNTFTASNKAAQAAAVGAAFDAVGARLADLDAQHTIEKITELTTSEDLVSSGFYIELPQTLANYPILIVSATNVRCHPGSNTGNPGYIVAVENLTSTTSLATLLSIPASLKETSNEAEFFYPVKADPTTVYINNKTIPDTKYLYVTAGTLGLAAGAHFEIWGAVK